MSKRRSHGEGTIYFSKTHDRWVAQITLPNGKRKTKSSKTQKEARKWLFEQRKALNENMMVEDDAITLEDHLNTFLEDVVQHTLRPKTIESYTYLINSHILPELGHVRLVQLRPNHLQSLYSKKLDQGLSKRTVQYIHAVLRRSLNQAVKWGLLARSPTDLVDPPKPKKKTPVSLNAKQVRTLLDSVKEHRWHPIYLLAVTTGMREGELLGLHWEDVNLDKGLVHIRHQAQFLPGRGVVITDPKTKKSRRTIALADFVVEVLIKLEGRNGLVFRTGNDTPISPRNLLRHFHQVLEGAGLPKIRFHDLRHTAASLMLKQNVHPKVVQEMLGHSSISLTMDTYSHIIPSLQKEAAEKMDDLLNAEDEDKH